MTPVYHVCVCKIAYIVVRTLLFFTVFVYSVLGVVPVLSQTIVPYMVNAKTRDKVQSFCTH